MQPDLKYDMPPANSHEQCETAHTALQAEKEHGRHELHPPQQQDFLHQRWRRRPSPAMWHLILLLGDGIVLLALLELLLPLPPHLGLAVSGNGFGSWSTHFAWLCLALASWCCAVNIMQAQTLSCAASLLKSPLYVLGSLALMLVFCISFLYLAIGNEVVSYMSALLLFLAVAAPALVVWRVILAEAINVPRFRRQAVIVGVNAAGRSVARELLEAKHPSANVVGFISEEIEQQEQQDGLPVLGSRSALHSLAQSGVIDMLIMAIDYKDHPELFQEALAGAQRGLTVLPVTTVYESTSGKIPVEHLGDQWCTVMPAGHSSSLLYICWARMLDLMFGLCGLLILALSFPFLALLIYLDSPGPIFYTQERTGYHGRTFSIYKFRSMHTQKEQARRPAWLTKDDPRITRVGRFLRATHLDEVPQVLNILRGEMSLIGPRPERPAFVADLEESNIFYRYRLSVKPGLTGWAQVKYGYGVADQDELVKLQYDLYYIKHRSFLFDLLILLKTCIEVGCAHGS
ncbi:MAG: sugar transferase [Ktedonobacteraceae bacterium]|nr:sugar transferase [Chloroflexota bacterium]